MTPISIHLFAKNILKFKFFIGLKDLILIYEIF